ncbi:type IV pilus assembly protein PilW [Variovorax paradoxus]|uniref:PilW family protein n=1 Tax=Variovorax paradoxus TaxID=34073 RepID=UPI00278F4430|nr:PilW family protein [Variovorax paradoxus]MDQ0569726.1 type IV pilus assembly protein PilW [Variovorax paradoxus]
MAVRTPDHPAHDRQRGMTLVELMVAAAIGLMVVLAATATFIGSRQLFTANAEAQAVEDSLRFAGFVVRSIVRQAGYSDYAPDHAGFDGTVVIGSSANLLGSSDDPSDLDIVGASNARVGFSGESHGTHNSRGVNGSDSLRVRFFGRSRVGGDDSEPDGTMVDCMGFAQAGPSDGQPSLADRAWSFFHVAEAADREPELYCKYRSDRHGAFRSEPLARGIEVFKVVYAYDGNGDGVPDRWIDAAQLEARAGSAAAINGEWRKVVGLRVGMVARGGRDNSGSPSQGELLYPLGAEFPGASFKPPADGRLRRTSTFTVMLRNAMKEPGP